ncbi:hypothetical protein BH10BAC3_BH10BAC3_32910 [soil metagenome]
MKTILVATDFSPAANNALQYAVKMARFLDAKIILYHAYLSENYIPDLVLLEPVKNLHEEFEVMLRKQVENLAELDKSNIELRCSPGIAAESIVAVANEVNAQWIVAGMKKTGLAFRKIFGTTALTLCRRSLVPLIIVPEDILFRSVRTIALASDLKVEHNLMMLDPLASFGASFNARLFVVNVRQKDAHGIDAKAYVALNMEWSMKELAPKFTFIDDENIGEALNDFIDSNYVDMLALVAHEHSLFERWFAKSTIKNMMFNGHVPLMILPDKSTIEITQESVPVIGRLAF